MSAKHKRGLKGLKSRLRSGWSHDNLTAWHRRQAGFDMMMFDHGLLRLAWRNFHPVHEGVWRSSQPDPPMIARLAARGFRSVLNLRGDTGQGAYLLEREACTRYGLALVDLKMQSRKLPEVDTVRKLDAIFGEIDRPFVIHCKSGADRSGFAAALYLLLYTTVPIAVAKRQLSARYLHFRRSATGVLDHMLEAHEVAAAGTGRDFRSWVFSDYDPEELMATFRGGTASDFLVDRVLRRE
jgi:protein tyrosine/serine phosphatase